jgi:DNA-binding transcriptional regulator YiaG
MEMRVAMLELAVRDLANAMSQIKAIRDGRSKLPTLPEGSGLALSIARQRAGWAGRELAAAIGVSRSLLSLWETERMSIPRWRADALRAIFEQAGADPPEWSDDDAGKAR